MSARSVMQSPLVRNASSLKEKMLEKKDKILEKGLLKRRSSSNTAAKGRDAQLLTKEELPLLMDCVKTLAVHLRARIEMEKAALQAANATPEEIAEKTRVFETNSETTNPMRVLSDARTIRTVVETGHKNLLNALNKFAISTIAGVIRLIFQSADVPLLKAEICAEIFSLQDNASKNRVPIDIDDLRAVLGKAPARNIDILGQLVALLSLDAIGPARLAYSWGPLIFLPRFDHKTSVTKDYESFDLVRQTSMVISVTKLMIEQCVEVFGLDDEDVIRKMTQEIREQQAMDLKQAAMEVLRQSSSSKLPQQQQPQPPVNKVSNQQAAQVVARPSGVSKVIGTCKIMYDFDAEGPLEISVPQGEMVSILEKGDDSWWKIRTRDGKEGLVPETYVEEMADIEEEEQDEDDDDDYEQKEQESPNNYFDDTNIITSEDFVEPSASSFPEGEQQEDEQMDQENAGNVQEEQEEEIEDEIAALQRKLNELQKLKETKRRSSFDQQSVAPAAPPLPPPVAMASPKKTTPPALPVRKQPPPKPQPSPAVNAIKKTIQPESAPKATSTPLPVRKSVAPATPLQVEEEVTSAPASPARASFLPSAAALAARKSGLNNAGSASPVPAASPAVQLKKTVAPPAVPSKTSTPVKGGGNDLQAAIAARAARMSQQQKQ